MGRFVWWRAVAVAAIAVGLAAGCGGGDGDRAAGPTVEEGDGQDAQKDPSDDPDATSGADDPAADDEDTDDATRGEPNDSAEEDDSTEPNDSAEEDDSTEPNDSAEEDDSTEEDDQEDDPEPEIDPEDLLTPVEPGDKGEDVTALQTRLDELGFSPGRADGSYGRRTEAAVSIFQELNDLRPTGEADARTMRALATYTYDGLTLAAGDEGDEVERLQERLAGGPFDPGPIDGEYGRATVAAVWALEKLAGVPVDGDWGPADELAWQRLTDGEVGQPTEQHDQRWVEVDLSEQLAKVYDPGESTPVLISHISSGSGIPWSNEEYSGSSITPTGEFHVYRRISGWRESSLNIGRLYNPLYFVGGIAFHGATSVPLYPASHGCVRVPMHIAEYLPDELPDGTPVHVMA